MDAFKKFLKDKKVNKHFKKTGPGQRLSDNTSAGPSIVGGTAQGSHVDRVAASDVAAQAAIKRLYKNEPSQELSYSQKKIQMMAKKELEEERQRNDATMGLKDLTISQRTTDVREFEHSDAIEQVFFTCELLGDDVALPKAELTKVIEEFLLEQVSVPGDDNVIPAILLIFSVNSRNIRESCVEILIKYLQNIIEHPDEDKYWRIRLSNKAYQEKVKPIKGSCEFLKAVGFEEVMMPMKDGDAPEPFLAIQGVTDEVIAKLVGALDAIRNGQSVPIKVARNASIFFLNENQKISTPNLSSDFYNLSASEVKKEQQLKTEEVERLLSLRTKEMREKDERLRDFKYKYSLVRIRLPDRFIIQGTFACHEPLSAIRLFICDHLSPVLIPTAWKIRDPMNLTRPLEENKSIGELGLAPAAVLHLEWIDPVQGPYLDQRFIDIAKEFVL